MEGPDEAHWAADERLDAVIAMTARAADALDRSGVPFTAIGDYVHGPALAALDQAVVDQAVLLVERVERAFAVGDASARALAAARILSDQSYFLCHAASVVAARTHMIAKVLERAGDAVHLILGAEPPPVFAANGYSRSPWLGAVTRMVESASGEIEIRRAPAPRDLVASSQPAWRRAAGPMAAWWRRRRPVPPPVTAGISGPNRRVRLLLPDGVSHDWSAVAGALMAEGVELRSLTTSSLGQHPQFPIYAGPLRDGAGRAVTSLPTLEIVDGAQAGAAIDAWRAVDPSWRFDADGVDVLDDLIPYLRSIAVRAASMYASIDTIAAAAIDRASPDIVGFWAMASFSDRRFAAEARRRNIPVVCYQHGGAYGTHRIASHALLELGLADHLLTYGDGIRFERSSLNVVAPARTWSVGSSRIESQLRGKPARVPFSAAPDAVRVLWVAETSTFNTDSSGFVVEDTTRFAMEREGLQLLARSGSFDVCYRPYPGTEHKVATVDWIRRMELPRVRIDSRSPMATLIADADLIVTMTSSGTVWNEVLAFEAPLLLFCERDHPHLYPAFADAVDRACIWCQSRAAFEASLATLAADPARVIALWHRPSADFVAQFVLPDDQRTCAARVCDAVSRIAASRHDPTGALTTGTTTIRG